MPTIVLMGGISPPELLNPQDGLLVQGSPFLEFIVQDNDVWPSAPIHFNVQVANDVNFVSLARNAFSSQSAAAFQYESSPGVWSPLPASGLPELVSLGELLRPRIAQSTATTYYVDDANGDDSRTEVQARSEATPWKTIQKAIDSYVLPGSGGVLILVKNHAGSGYQKTTGSGTLMATMDFTNLTGRVPSASNVLTVKNYPGHRPVVLQSTPGTVENNAMRANSGSTSKYIRVQGFEFIGDDANVASDSGGTALIGINNGDHIEIYDCILHDILSDVRAQGIFLGGGSDNVQVWNCLIYSIGNKLGAQANLEHGIYVQGSNHQIVNTLSRDQRNGFGFQLFGGSDAAPAHILSHVVATGNKMSGLTIDGSTYSNIEVHNSIFAFNDQHGVIGRNNASGNVKNSIAFGNGTGGFSNESGGAMVFADNLTSDPLFADYATRNLHLQGTSPAINYAQSAYSPTFDLDGNLRPSGLAVDVGAYEYSLAGVSRKIRYAPALGIQQTYYWRVRIEQFF